MKAPRQQANGLVPIITVTTTDGKTRLAEYKQVPAPAKKMLKKLKQDIIKIEQALRAAEQDTFTANAMRVMLDEAKNYMKADHNSSSLLPEGWTKTFISLLNKAESQIANARANDNRETITSCALALQVPTNERVLYHQIPPPSSPNMVNQEEPSAATSDNTIATMDEILRLRERANDSADRIFMPFFSALADLQIETQALLSVVQAEQMQMRALSCPQMSDTAFASVLLEEADILTTVLLQFANLGHVPDANQERKGETILLQRQQHKLEALAAQLQAIYNIKCQEREPLRLRASKAINEWAERRMAVENQNRMDVLGEIRRIVAEVLHIDREMAVAREHWIEHWTNAIPIPSTR